MNDLTTARKIRLIRCENGWLAHDSAVTALGGDIDPNKPIFVFQSTEHLARDLVRLVGKSGWEVAPESASPRDVKGRFSKLPE